MQFQLLQSILVMLLPIAAFAYGANADLQQPSDSQTDAGLPIPNCGTVDAASHVQAALDQVRARGGGVVEIPAGRYRFEGPLSVPDHVTLRGVFTYAPSSAGIRDAAPGEEPVYGTVFEVYAGAGEAEGTPFISLHTNSTLQGVTIHYPAQDPKADAPTPYPWTIQMRGNNPAVLDVQLLNPYQGIDASRNQRALIRNVHGQPIFTGIFVDEIYDIGRIENVHWNPWWSYKTPVFEWQRKHGTGFLFGRTDWHYVLNTFCFGYAAGYRFTATKEGAANGNFLGIGADYCHTAVLVEETAPMGVLITNGEFVAFDGDDPTMVRVEKTHGGTVRFVNCAFWGPSRRNALIDGTGTVGFGDCTFMQWDHKKEGVPSVEAIGGTLLLRGCEFMEPKPQIRLGPGVQRAIVTENLINGRKRIENDSRGNTVIRDNVAAPKGWRWKEPLKKMSGFRAWSLRRAEAANQ